MQTHIRKQMTVICEAPIMRRIKAILDQFPVSGYTVYPALSGKGSEGEWDRDNWIGEASRMVTILTILPPDEADAIIEAVYQALEPQMGIITLSDVEVLRPERF